MHFTAVISREGERARSLLNSSLLLEFLEDSFDVPVVVPELKYGCSLYDNIRYVLSFYIFMQYTMSPSSPWICPHLKSKSLLSTDSSKTPSVLCLHTGQLLQMWFSWPKILALFCKSNRNHQIPWTGLQRDFTRWQQTSAIPSGTLPPTQQEKPVGTCITTRPTLWSWCVVSIKFSIKFGQWKKIFIKSANCTI